MNPYAAVSVVEASSASIGDMLAAVDYAAERADVVSMSWGVNDSAAVDLLTMLSDYKVSVARKSAAFGARREPGVRDSLETCRGQCRLPKVQKNGKKEEHLYLFLRATTGKENGNEGQSAHCYQSADDGQIADDG